LERVKVTCNKCQGSFTVLVRKDQAIYSRVNICPKCQALQSSSVAHEQGDDDLETKISLINLPKIDDMREKNSMQSKDIPLKKHIKAGDFFNKG
jgi:hypothetical protein